MCTSEAFACSLLQVSGAEEMQVVIIGEHYSLGSAFLLWAVTVPLFSLGVFILPLHHQPFFFRVCHKVFDTFV